MTWVVKSQCHYFASKSIEIRSKILKSEIKKKRQLSFLTQDIELYLTKIKKIFKITRPRAR